MPLSKQEQKVLEELEKQLLEDGPTMIDPLAPKAGGYWSTRHVLTGVLTVLTGVLLLLAGITLPNLTLGVLGFVLMGAGTYLATLPAGGRRRSGRGVIARAGRAFAKGAHETATWSLIWPI